MRLTALTLGALAVAAPLAAGKGHGRRGHLVEPSEHPAGHLFSRSANTHAKRQLPNVSKNGMPYPEAGANPPPQSSLPQAWIDRYNQKKKAGLIPDIPASITADDGSLAYPEGTDMEAACSWTLDKCDTGDIWLAPENSVAITFDDGPTPQSPELISYLQEEKQGATHFLIGSAIVWNFDIMDEYIKANPPMHLGVHTWSHTLQTGKTDMEVLGDLGWTMQIIYDLTGRVPMFWRPPEGDVDARVRAIAKEVLGLQTVMWNKDADDWCLRQGTGTAKLETCETGVGANMTSVVSEMRSWAKNKDKTGFISLEHETTDQAINSFKKYHHTLKTHHWNVVSVPELQGLPYYQNQWNLTSDIEDTNGSILPVRKAIDVEHSDAARGSSNAPDTSSFADLNGSGAPAAVSKSAQAQVAEATVSTAGSSSTGTSSQSSTSGATKSSLAETGLFASLLLSLALLM